METEHVFKKSEHFVILSDFRVRYVWGFAKLFKREKYSARLINYILIE